MGNYNKSTIQVHDHVHDYSGSTSVNFNHLHNYNGTTGPAIPSGESHYHEYSGWTTEMMVQPLL